MHIGIIGAGQIGGCLAAKLTALGHTVSITNSRGPATLQQLAAYTGATAVTAEDVTKDKDVIIITIPQKNIPALPRQCFQHLSAGTVIIDTGNYYPILRDGEIPSLEQTGIDSLWVQQQLGISVVKVFNSIFASSLQSRSKPKGAADRIALPVAGDNTAAKAIVSALVDALGFDPYDGGTIAQSWKQQPGSPVYCRDLPLAELKKRYAAMAAEPQGMIEKIIAKHRADEELMKRDFPAFLKSLQN